MAAHWPGKLQPTEPRDARVQLHRAAQVLSAAADRWLPPQPDYSHMEWLPERRCWSVTSGSMRRCSTSIAENHRREIPESIVAASTAAKNSIRTRGAALRTVAPPRAARRELHGQAGPACSSRRSSTQLGAYRFPGDVVPSALRSKRTSEAKWRWRESKSTGTPTRPSACCTSKSLASRVIRSSPP